jgi:Rrf2 family nitric oxide-sensitive transcriptional repressor
MRLTTRTNLAMRTLMYCAVNKGRTVRRHEIAEACNASENHLAQVIHLMAQRGFIRTVRGRNGGLSLGRDAEDIVVGDVFRSFEAPLPFADCFVESGCICPLQVNCRLRGGLSAALDAFYGTLDRMSVSDLVRDNRGLQALLAAS